MQSITLTSHVQTDNITSQIKSIFDFDFNGDIITEIPIPIFPQPELYSIGLIVGSSGSGKTTILNTCFEHQNPIYWNNAKSILSNFDNVEDGIDKLGAVGLNSIPSWCKPYCVLSTGEKFRADLARSLKSNTVIDEFTSTVNRQVAKSCSYAVQKYIRNHNLHGIVFGSCHDDIINYLLPDWIYNTDTHQFIDTDGCLQRDKIELSFEKTTTDSWVMFKKHHYLNSSINKSCNCWIVKYENKPVAFIATLAYPSGTVKHAFREHRLVVLPDFQGIGIGNAVSEAVGQAYIEVGCRYFSKTANPRCGIHRDNSPKWRATSKNHKKRLDYLTVNGEPREKKESALMQKIHSQRECYSHEYIGDGTKHPYTYKKNEAIIGD